MISFNYTNFDSSSNSEAIAARASRDVASAITKKQDLYQIFSTDLARSQIKDCEKIGLYIKNNYTDLIVVGMGGAMLNPQAVINLSSSVTSSSTSSPLQIHFLNNTDPTFFDKLLSNISLKNCAVLAISNSGNTLETNALVGTIVHEFEKQNIEPLGKQFFFITKTDSGVLSKIATQISATIIKHTPNISGRFSGLTNVTTLAAAIACVDVGSYIDGAEEVIRNFLHAPELSEAARWAGTVFSAGKPLTVNIAYLQSFCYYLEWYSQIIAESLGKDGKGMTPLYGLGPNDQHSMMQLYLDGPSDKIFSMFYVQDLPSSPKTCSLEELGNIRNRLLSDINTANFKATGSALISKKLPVRTIILKDLSAKSIGVLIAHSMLETIILAHMMQVNPFNQPGVELIKSRSMELLK